MSEPMRPEEIRRRIREVPDFPRQGIRFYDVAPLFRDPAAFRGVVDRMAGHLATRPCDTLAGIEARGFVLAAALSYKLGAGLVLVRKQGKLPGGVVGETFELEYGRAHIEVQNDAVQRGDRVIVVDDLLATGGTARAAGRLVEKLGARIAGYAFMVELGFLGGRGRLGSDEVFSLLHYDGAGL